MADSTTDKGPRPPRTEAGRRVFRSLDLPDATSAVVTVADILDIEAEAVGLMYGSDQEAGYAAVAEAAAPDARCPKCDFQRGFDYAMKAAAPDAGLRDDLFDELDERFGRNVARFVDARVGRVLAAHRSMDLDGFEDGDR